MKLSPAMATILHIIWSGLFGLIISGGTAVYQYNATNGINLEQDAILFALAFTTGLGSTAISILHNVQASPALPLAEKEIEDGLATEAHQLAMEAHTKLDQMSAWLTTHMQTHNTMVPAMPVQSASTPSSLRPVTLQPMSATNPPVAPVTPNLPPSGAPLFSTVPEMPSVQAQQ